MGCSQAAVKSSGFWRLRRLKEFHLLSACEIDRLFRLVRNPTSMRAAANHPASSAGRSERRRPRRCARSSIRLLAGPSATTLPRSITTTRSKKVKARSRSCTTTTDSRSGRRCQRADHVEAMADVEAGRRLVGQQHRRIDHQHGREQHARPLAARQRRPAAPAELGQLELFRRRSMAPAASRSLRSAPSRTSSATLKSQCGSKYCGR